MDKIKGIYWTPKAKKNIHEIVEYISRDSEYNAKIFTKKLINSTRRLKNHPYSGRKVPEYNIPTLREIIYRPYRIIYRVNEKESQIEILTVYHGSRLLEDL